MTDITARLIEALDGLMTFAPSCAGSLPGMTRGGRYINLDDAREAVASVASAYRQHTEAQSATVVRIWRGVGELERAGYIPAGSADEREAATTHPVEQAAPAAPAPATDAGRDAASLWDAFIARLNEVKPLGDEQRHRSFLGSIESYRKVFLEANASAPPLPQGEKAPPRGWLLRWPKVGAGYSWLWHDGPDEPTHVPFPRIPLYEAAPPPPAAQPVALTDEQIEKGREATFSTGNPFCPCDSKTMRKAVRWAECAHGIGIPRPDGEKGGAA